MATFSEITNWIHNHPVWTVIGVGISSYIGRYLLKASAYNGKYGITVSLVYPLVCILFLPYMISFGYGIFSIIRYKNLVLFPAIIISYLAAVHLPLPPLPKGDAAQHFFEHRDRYETIVEQARQQNLETEQLLFSNVYVVNSVPLAIVFTPKNMSRAVIVFSESKAYLDQVYVCNGDGSVYEQLDEHWWVCFIDWL